MNNPEDISATLRIIYARLDTLARITSANIPLSDGPQMHYHEIIEESYVALGEVETVIEELRTELEYQHQRLDEIIASILKVASEEGR